MVTLGSYLVYYGLNWFGWKQSLNLSSDWVRVFYWVSSGRDERSQFLLRAAEQKPVWGVEQSCRSTSHRSPALCFLSFSSSRWTLVSPHFPPPLTFYRGVELISPLRDAFDTSFISIMTAGCLRLGASVIMWLSAIIKQLSPWWMLCFHSLMSEGSETGSLFPSLSLWPQGSQVSLRASLLVCLPGSHSPGCTCFSAYRWRTSLFSLSPSYV